jgi:uncharacterized protein YegJ (DUF2314 family)
VTVQFATNRPSPQPCRILLGGNAARKGTFAVQNMIKGILLLGFLSGGSVFLGGCSRKPQQKLMAAGSPMGPYIHFEYAIYMMPIHTRAPGVVLRHALAEQFTKLKLVEDLPKEPHEMFVKVRTEEDVQGKYSPPSPTLLEYSGHGLTREQELQLQKTQEAFILDFAHPKEDVWTALRVADELVEKIAGETGGLVWDEETREVFSPEALHKRRIAEWRDTVPSISTHTVIHSYNNGEFVRAISLGMAKAGLPDIVVEELPEFSTGQVGHVINLFSQALAEGTFPKKTGQFRLDVRAIQNTAARESQVNSLKPNGTGIACLTLKEGHAEEGDPKNEIIEITFDKYTGNDSHVKLDAALGWMFGVDDSVTDVEHTDELLEESRKEKAHLPRLHKAFDAGLRPGEYIMVKAPFKQPDGGSEWMWVEVRSWKGQSIRGLLDNDPVRVPGLHGGQLVEVQETDLFDYIRHFPDGHQEGNTTGEIISKMEQKEKTPRPEPNRTPPPECVD